MSTNEQHLCLSEVNVSAASEDLLSFWFFCLWAEWVHSENVTSCLIPLHHHSPFLCLFLFPQRLFVCLFVRLFCFYMFNANHTPAKDRRRSLGCSKTLHQSFWVELLLLVLLRVNVPHWLHVRSASRCFRQLWFIDAVSLLHLAVWSRWASAGWELGLWFWRTDSKSCRSAWCFSLLKHRLYLSCCCWNYLHVKNGHNASSRGIVFKSTEWWRWNYASCL